MQQGERENRIIAAGCEALHRCLSDLGRRVAFPPDIPFQAAEARGKKFNATIGQITTGSGRVLSLPTIEACLDLEEAALNRAQLYSPVQGNEELRRAWRIWQRRRGPEVPSSLPIVTVGLTHGLSIAADLFGGPGRAVAIPSPYWGNYRQTFATRTGATVLSASAYRDGAYNTEAIAEALADLPPDEPAVAILNLPSNPGGYSATSEDREALRRSLVGVAEQRPLVLLCDDAYAGLVYEDEVPNRSMFWDLIDLHPNLVPVKIDGATKEFNLFGGRVGFLTFPFEPESEIALALESKIKCLTRSTVGSPVSVSQILILEGLANAEIEAEIEAVRSELARRYRSLRSAVAQIDRSLLTPMPFNSGCFALFEIPRQIDVDPEDVRQHLLAEHDTGLIAIRPNFLRIAFCSVDAAALPEVVQRLERGVAELVADG